MGFLKVCLLALLLATVAQSSLQVYMPMCAVQQVTTAINYTLANFGHIPYGKTVIGELVVLRDDDKKFCDSDNNQSFYSLDGESIKKFVLIERGDCKFTKKILNAQKKGAEMVIIYDNEDTSVPGIVMSNDGHGHLIDIPSVFISKADANKLIGASLKCSSSLIMKIYFDVFTSKVANVTFWLDINNRESFITLRDFSRDYHGVIAKSVNYDVKFKVNRFCGRDNCDANDCVKDGKQFCLFSNAFVGGNRRNGKDLIEEEVRSFYLFEEMKNNKSVEKWFKYMVKFDEKVCIQELDIKTCSEAIMKEFTKVDPIAAKVKEAMSMSTAQSGKSNVIQNFAESAEQFDILFYPEVSINNRNFYGLFRAADIFEMICSSLQSPPKECHSFLKNDKKDTFSEDVSNGLWKTVLLIILAMVVFFFIALFGYNQLIRREMNQEMSMEVNKMVEHYVAMTEEKSRSNAAME